MIKASVGIFVSESKVKTVLFWMVLAVFVQFGVNADSFYVVVTEPPYNADASGKADATNAIQTAIAMNKKTIVPKGDFRIDGTLVIGKDQHLHLSTGAWLKRIAVYTDNTKPVVRLIGHHAALTGDGHACGVMSDNRSGGNTGDEIINNGIVNVGPSDARKLSNLLWWNINSLVIHGNAKAYQDYRQPPFPSGIDKNELLTVVCGQGISKKAGATYNGNITNVLFKHGGIGIKLNPISNGHIISNNFFFGISDSAISVEKCTENVVSNLFIHNSPGSVSIRLKDVGYCHFYGIMAEPGPTAPNGRLSMLYDIDEKSFQNVILGHGNTGHAAICRNPDNMIYDHARLIEIGGKKTPFKPTVKAGSTKNNQ